MVLCFLPIVLDLYTADSIQSTDKILNLNLFHVKLIAFRKKKISILN